MRRPALAPAAPPWPQTGPCTVSGRGQTHQRLKPPSHRYSEAAMLLVLAGCGLRVSVVLTLCGAEVGLVDGPGVVVDLADAHAPLIALDLRQPVRELHLLGVFYLHSVP